MAPAKVPAHVGKGSYFDDYTKLSSVKMNSFDGNTFNIWDYLRVEMFGIGEPGTLEPPNQAHIQNFFLVPMNLESLIFLGFFVCLDAFLYVITYLPIRVVFSVFLLGAKLQSYLFNVQLGTILPYLFPRAKDQYSFTFHRTQGYDIMRGAMFVVGCIALRQINMSQIYHFIRGQSMIKLYVLTSMLEIVDKLLCSFGQDAFDALHWHTRFQPRSLQMVLTFVMVTCYVCLHSAVYFLHVATLTVVINSVDSALITVLILNNFAELKSFVLKKFDCNNLFQLACSDITERFQMFLFLVLILIVALAQAGPTWPETLYSFSKIALMMFVSEIFADWFKHAFINKFNLINASVYQDFAYVLRNDILSNQKDEVILDHTYSVTRRLGLSQIPLGCVCFRYVHLAYSTPAVQMYTQELSLPMLLLQCTCLFAGLVVLKILIGVGLVFYAAGAHKRDAAVFLRTPAMAKTSDRISSGSGTGTFHNTVSANVNVNVNVNASVSSETTAPTTAGYLPGGPLKRLHSIESEASQDAPVGPPKAGLTGVGIAGIAVSPIDLSSRRNEHMETPSNDHSHLQGLTPQQHTPAHHTQPSNVFTPQYTPAPPTTHSLSRSHSIANPFTEIHVSAEEVRRVVAAVGVEGAEEYIESQVEQQQMYVGPREGVHIVPTTLEIDTSKVDPSADRESSAHTHATAPSQQTSPTRLTSLPGAHTAPRSHRPPLGRLNIVGHNNTGDFADRIVTPPLSPLNRSASNSISGDSYPLYSPGYPTTTSTPIVQLDAHAFNQHLKHNNNALANAGRAAHNDLAFTGGDGSQEDDAHSDNEDTRSNMSDVSRITVLEEAEAQRMKERLEFMEELSSIERYTVYKGRII